MVRDFQSVIGDRSPRADSRKPKGGCRDVVIASVGGGSNAMGIFHPFLDEPGVRLIGVEAAGRGLDTNEHAASIERGQSQACSTATAPICCRMATARLPRRIPFPPGLDYPGIGPEHFLAA